MVRENLRTPMQGILKPILPEGLMLRFASEIPQGGKRKRLPENSAAWMLLLAVAGAIAFCSGIVVVKALFGY